MDNEYFNTINKYYNTFDGSHRVESCVETCRNMSNHEGAVVKWLRLRLLIERSDVRGPP